MRLVWCVVVAAAMLLSPGAFPKARVSPADGAQGANIQPVQSGGAIKLAMLAPPITLAALAPPRSAIEPRSGPDQSLPRSEQPAAPEPEQPAAPADDAEPYEPFVLQEAPDEPPTTNELCAMLEAEANVRALPAVFFVRLIWQESRFDPLAVSPKGARGIAQFMPATAAERGLEDPFDAVKALGKSAQWLSELKEEFGNLGLAAAAYNAGPGRVQRWLDGASKLPRETRNYVEFVTGRAADDWKEGQTELPETLFADVASVQDWCRGLPVRRLAKPRIEDTDEAETEADQADAPKPWGVQIAAGTSKKKALKLLASAKKRHGDVFEEVEPAVVRKRTPGRGRKPLYAVRVALDTREAADDLCSRLRKDGGACTVLKN